MDPKQIQKQVNADIRALRRRIGRKIQTIRHTRSLRLETLAKQSGLSITQIDELEPGKGNLNIPHILHLAYALNINPAILLKQ